MILELEHPEAGSEPLHFPQKFAVSRMSQLKTILWKNNQVYWRYTGVRPNRVKLSPCDWSAAAAVTCNIGRHLHHMQLCGGNEHSVLRHSSHNIEMGGDVDVCCAAEYNTLRACFIFVMALFFGTAFWQMGERKSSRNDILTVMVRCDDLQKSGSSQ